MVINERQAEIIRHVFETYATQQIGLDKIAQDLENAGMLTATGKTVWRRSFLKTMLSNETYLGVKYYNQMRTIRQYANPIYGIEHSTKKNIKRGREDWIGINIPAIISQELFDKVQKRLEDNRKHYRNPREPQLLSNLVRCGVCGSSGFALRRWVRSTRKYGPVCVIHDRAYKCNWSYQGRLHTKASGIKRCRNPQVRAELIEGKVLEMVKDIMLDPARLRGCMDYFRDDRQAAEATLQKELKAIDARLATLHEQKRRIVDIYASGDLSRDGYIEKNRELDAMIETLRAKGKELADSAALLREDEAIATGIEQFCEGARVRFKKCKDFASTRQFLLDYVEKVTHVKDKVSLHGRVPIRHTTGNDTEINELAFCIEAEITREDRYRERMRVSEALDYQQSVALLREQQASDVSP
jgi:site-specific DNA recombinase